LSFYLTRNNSHVLLIHFEVISVFIILKFIISYWIYHASDFSCVCSLLFLIFSLHLGRDAIFYNNRSWFLTVNLWFFSCSLRTRLLWRSCQLSSQGWPLISL
jgi:hypothetical protein